GAAGGDYAAGAGSVCAGHVFAAVIVSISVRVSAQSRASAHANHAADERGIVGLLAVEPDFWRDACGSSAGLQRWLRYGFNFSGGRDSRTGGGDSDADS